MNSDIGHYRVLEKLGEGGMGVVYRARDTKLNRDVAIKVLPAHLTADPDRVARFEREAQTLAALNHPNIAHVYGTEQHALVMEYVPGDDLAVRLRRGPMDVNDALGIARQIALALEAAHAASVIHRDLKPANIKVTSDGTVKVLDFGLAKMWSQDGTFGSADQAQSPTMTSPALTQHGVILGTAAYMAPEQARGRAIDKRADIWAFGCVVYEFLTARAAFSGETVTDVLAAVVTKDPDWSALPSDTPAPVRRLLARCLQKDPKNRLHDIADARIELDAAPTEAPAVAATTGAVTRRTIAPGVSLLAIGLAAGAAAGIFWQRSQTVPPVHWEGSRLGGPSITREPRVSPDGHMIAFQAMVDGQTQIAVMKPGTGSWTVLTRDRTRGLVDGLAWSPSGSHIYYDRYTDTFNGIFSVPSLGGEERLVIERAGTPVPLADGSLLFYRINTDRITQLHRFWPDKGTEEALPFVTANASLATYGLVAPLDADRIAFVGRPVSDKAAPDQLLLIELASHTSRQIGQDLNINGVGSLAVDPTDRSILLSVREANMYRVVRIHPDRSPRAETVLTFLSIPIIDVAPSGAIYLSLEDRPYEILRFVEAGTPIERLDQGLTHTGPAVPLPDGRFLVTSRVGGRARVVVQSPGKEPVRLVQTDLDTQWPMTAVGSNRAAVMLGANREHIAIVAVETGGIVTRLAAPAGVTSLGASPDGTTLYISAGGSITAVRVDTGEVRQVGAGDSMVVDPETGDLVAKLDEVNQIRLVRIGAAGGAPQTIPVRHANLRFTQMPLSAGSIRKGRLLLPVATADSWNWYAGLLNLGTSELTRVPVAYETDFHYATWTADGRVLGSTLGTIGTLWKFEKR